MMTKTPLILIALLLVAAIGCDDDNVVGVVDEVPAAPQGVFSVTGNNEVWLYWNGPYEADIVEFIVWRSRDPVENYVEIGRRPAEPNPNLDLWIYEYVDATALNGIQYFYAVSAVDEAGQISELSAELVFDTPHPEGMVSLYDQAVDASRAGFNFTWLISGDTAMAEVYVDRFQGIFYLNARLVTVDLQDMGYTDTLSDIGWAPQQGWSNLGFAEIIEGHTYVIRTGWPDDIHYHKMRVEGINTNYVVMSWASQRVKDNPELVPGREGSPDPATTTIEVRNTLAKTSLGK